MLIFMGKNARFFFYNRMANSFLNFLGMGGVGVKYDSLGWAC